MQKNGAKTAIIIVSLVLIVILTITIVSSQAKYSQLKSGTEEMENKIQEKQDSNAALSEMVNNGDDTENAGSIARDKLGYGLPTEKVYVNITGK